MGLDKFKRCFTIKQKTKLKLFQVVNKLLFCKLIKLHLPVQSSKGFTCVICKNNVTLG